MEKNCPDRTHWANFIPCQVVGFVRGGTKEPFLVTLTIPIRDEFRGVRGVMATPELEKKLINYYINFT